MRRIIFLYCGEILSSDLVVILSAAGIGSPEHLKQSDQNKSFKQVLLSNYMHIFYELFKKFY